MGPPAEAGTGGRGSGTAREVATSRWGMGRVRSGRRRARLGVPSCCWVVSPFASSLLDDAFLRPRRCRTQNGLLVWVFGWSAILICKDTVRYRFWVWVSPLETVFVMLWGMAMSAMDRVLEHMRMRSLFFLYSVPSTMQTLFHGLISFFILLN